MLVKGNANGCTAAIMGILMFLGGIWMRLSSLYGGYNSWNLVSKGNRVDAVVVHFDTQGMGGSDEGASSSPIFEYVVDGKTYQYTSQTYTNAKQPYQVGDHETLLYDPQNPQNAREDKFSRLWLTPLLMCPASLAVVIGAIAIMVVYRKRS